jgi:outer membrane murein-binding lipoprotein Lpp
MTKRDEYIERMKKQLDDLNSQLDELETKSEATRSEYRAKYDKHAAEVRVQYASALAKLDEVKEASEDKWESLVQEGEKVQKALVHSFNYFKAELKKS